MYTVPTNDVPTEQEWAAWCGRYGDVLTAVWNRSNHEECFHRDDSCQSIVKAHSIQRGVLKEIAEDGHVLCMRCRFHGDPHGMDFSKTGTKIATTFTGFCSYHDSALFTPIDTESYEPGNQQQEFLYAYRALANIWHAKHSTHNFYKTMHRFLSSGENSGIPELCHLMDCSVASRQKVANRYAVLAETTSRSLKQLSHLQRSMNTNMARERFWKIKTIHVLLPNQHHLAASSAFFIQRDFDGNVINDLANNKARDLAPAFLTIIPQRGETHVLFSCLSKHDDRFGFLKEGLARSSESEIRVILTNIIAVNVQNFVVAPSKWYSLPTHQSQRFLELFHETINYSSPDVPARLVPYPDLDIFL